MLPADAGAFGLGGWMWPLGLVHFLISPGMEKKKFGLFCWICLSFATQFCEVVATVLLFLFIVLKINSQLKIK